MRAMTFFGSLLLSAAMCGQSFGGAWAARLLGLESFDNCECGQCAPACEPAGEASCESACETCEPACGRLLLRERLCQMPLVCRMFAGAPEACEEPCSEPECCETDCSPPRWTPVRNLLTDLRVVLFSDRRLMDCFDDDGCGYCGGDASCPGAAPSAPEPVKPSPTPAPDEAPKAVPEPDAAPIPPAPAQ